MLHRVAEAWARGAAAAESAREDAAAGRGGRAEGAPDAGPAAGAGHGAGGAHTGEEGPVPQACGIPGLQPGKSSSARGGRVCEHDNNHFILCAQIFYFCFEIAIDFIELLQKCEW